jgi:TP901 family phage tail tape measure protein
MAAKDLAIKLIIGAKDEASGVLDKTRNSAGLLSEAFSALIKLAPAIGFGAAVKSAADFETALLKVQAAGGLTSEQLARLEAEANRLSALPELSYSAAQAAEGFEVLTRAGQNVEQQIGTLNSVMNFAQGQALSLDQAAGIVTTRLDQFGLAATTAAEAQANAARVTDVLAKAATLANTDVTQLGAAMDNINVQAKLNGTSLESVAAALDVLAKNGVRGSEAGTYLADTFSRLNDPASKLSQNLSAVGISSRDFAGVVNEVSRNGLDLNQVLSGLDETTRKAFQIFLSGDAPAAFNQFSTELQKATGYSANAAATMGNSLGAAFDALMSTVDAAARQFAKPFLDPLKNSLSQLSGAVGGLAESGVLEKLGTAFATMAQRAIDSLTNLFEGFDFTLAQGRIETFTQVAGEKFDELLNNADRLVSEWTRRWDVLSASVNIGVEGITVGFGAIKNGVVTVKNTVEAAFGALASSLTGYAADIANSLANLADAVGADELAKSTRETAENLLQTSQGLSDGVQKDLAEMEASNIAYRETVDASAAKISAAWDVINGKTTQSAAIQQQALIESTAGYPQLEALLASVAKQSGDTAAAVANTGAAATQTAQQLYDGYAEINGQLVQVEKQAAQTTQTVNDGLDENKQKNEEAAAAATAAAEKTATAQAQVTQAVADTGEAAAQAAGGFNVLAQIAGAGLAQVASLSNAAAANLRQTYIDTFNISGEALDRFSGKAGATTENFVAMAQEARDALRESSTSILDFTSRWVVGIRDAATQATLAFANQSIALQNLTARYASLDSAAGKNILTVEELRRRFDYLDEAQLSGAVAEIERLNDAAKGAAESLSDMTDSLLDELDRLNENQAAIEERRYQAQIEKLRALAAASGQSAQEQLALAEKIHQAKMRQIDDEAEEKKRKDEEESAREKEKADKAAEAERKRREAAAESALREQEARQIKTAEAAGDKTGAENIRYQAELRRLKAREATDDELAQADELHQTKLANIREQAEEQTRRDKEKADREAEAERKRKAAAAESALREQETRQIKTAEAAGDKTGAENIRYQAELRRLAAREATDEELAQARELHETKLANIREQADEQKRRDEEKAARDSEAERKRKAAAAESALREQEARQIKTAEAAGDKTGAENIRYQAELRRLKAREATDDELAQALELHQVKLANIKEQADEQKKRDEEKSAREAERAAREAARNKGGDTGSGTSTTRSTTEPVKTVIVQIGNRKVEVVAGQEQALIDALEEALGRS